MAQAPSQTKTREETDITIVTDPSKVDMLTLLQSLMHIKGHVIEEKKIGITDITLLNSYIERTVKVPVDFRAFCKSNVYVANFLPFSDPWRRAFSELESAAFCESNSKTGLYRIIGGLFCRMLEGMANMPERLPVGRFLESAGSAEERAKFPSVKDMMRLQTRAARVVHTVAKRVMFIVNAATKEKLDMKLVQPGQILFWLSTDEPLKAEMVSVLEGMEATVRSFGQDTPTHMACLRARQKQPPQWPHSMEVLAVICRTGFTYSPRTVLQSVCICKVCDRKVKWWMPWCDPWHVHDEEKHDKEWKKMKRLHTVDEKRVISSVFKNVKQIVPISKPVPGSPPAPVAVPNPSPSPPPFPYPVAQQPPPPPPPPPPAPVHYPLPTPPPSPVSFGLLQQDLSSSSCASYTPVSMFIPLPGSKK